jgi:glycosyltransferase involved in cell wall biosynthesis
VPSNSLPLVSVIVPVYNGEASIADAIRSVLRQTYQHFDVTVADNRSTDRTAEIAGEFARQDPRIRLVTYEEHVNEDESHNLAFTLVSSEATYCKILGADDRLFPECLAALVDVAEQHPSTGMVSSYALQGARVAYDGLPYSSTFMPGREVCRMRFLQNVKCFGGPSTSLLRASVVRSMRPFYTPSNFHGDDDAYLRLLSEHDFGFVHQVLSYNCRDETSRTTSYLCRVQSDFAQFVHELTAFAPMYLTEVERRPLLRAAWNDYYRFLAHSLFERHTREFWAYHFQHVARMGYRISKPRLALHALSRVADVLFNPLRTVSGVARRLGRLLLGPPSATA